MSLFGGNGRSDEGPAPTQEHVPIKAVQDDVLVTRPMQGGGRIVAAVVRVGSEDVTRMSQGERRDFLDRYSAVLAKWRFPYQILVWRERQNLAEFRQRVRDKQESWESKGWPGWSDILQQLDGWVERVIVQANPQMPAYFIALPYTVSDLLGSPYEKALDELDSRCHTVIHNLATLNIGCVRLDGDEIIDMISTFYHPSLPMLRIPPRERLKSLMVGESK